jgi:hypothetical protein
MERTDEEWKDLAVRYCQALGVDPDVMVSHGADADERGFVPAVLVYSPRWQRVLRDIRPGVILHDLLTSHPTR